MAGTRQLTQEGLQFIRSIHEQEKRPTYREIKDTYNKMARICGWFIIKSDSTIKNYARRLGIYKPVINIKEPREHIDNSRVPRHGYIKELAEVCECSRHTVRLALYDNQPGEKSDEVRREYRSRYVQPYESINN